MTMKDYTSRFVGSAHSPPKVFGDIKYHHVDLNRRQKMKLEREMIDWIFRHAFIGEEIQYWMVFNKVEQDHLINCRIEVFGGSRVWESSESSPEPFMAFRRTISTLTPTLSNTA